MAGQLWAGGGSAAHHKARGPPMRLLRQPSVWGSPAIPEGHLHPGVDSGCGPLDAGHRVQGLDVPFEGSTEAWLEGLLGASRTGLARSSASQ